MNILKLEKRMQKLLELTKEYEEKEKQSFSLELIKNEKLSNTIDMINYKTVENNKKYISLLQASGNQYEFASKTTRVNFDSNNYILENNGFEIDTNNGILFFKPNIVFDVPVKEYIISNDGKKVMFNFNDSEVINFLSYEFYKENGDPADLNTVKITGTAVEPVNGQKEISINDSFIRYFDDNYKFDSFLKAHIISPKKLYSVTFLFDEKIDAKKINVYFKRYEYSSDEKTLKLCIPNSFNATGPFKLLRNQFSKQFNMKYSYSYDNMFYNEMDFIKKINDKAFLSNEFVSTSIQENDFENLYIEIKSGEFISEIGSTEKITSSRELTAIKITDGVLKCQDEIKMDTLCFICSDDVKMEYDQLNKITDLFVETSIGSKINDSFIKVVNGITPDEKSKLLLTSYSNVVNGTKNFEIIYDTDNKTFYFPGYVKNISIQYDYVSDKIKIEPKYYTPIIFNIDISVFESED